jgi:hypothetical protein
MNQRTFALLMTISDTQARPLIARQPHMRCLSADPPCHYPVKAAPVPRQRRNFC